MQATCGNCGKPVGGSDITCPHCDVLLAAYASPSGATTTFASDVSAPVSDAASPIQISEPAPAPAFGIPDEIEAVSSAPRPLFDTNVTIEELMDAADGMSDESVVVKDDLASEPVMFDVPSYARPPADAAPVPLVEDAEASTIARPLPAENVPPRPDAASLSARSTAPSSPSDRADEPVGEGRLVGIPNVAPDSTRRRDQRVQKAADQVATERGRTEAYLRKLHAQTGYTPATAQRTKPVDTHTAEPVEPAAAVFTEDAALAKSRKGCSSLLTFVLFFLWVGVVLDILSGDFNPGLIFMAVALTFVLRFLGKPLNMAGRR